MATAIGNFSGVSWNSTHKQNSGFGGATEGPPRRRDEDNGCARMFRAKVTIERGGSLEGQILGSPIPNGGEAPIFPCTRGRSKKSGRRGAMAFPQLDYMRHVAGLLTRRVAGGRRYMGWACAACAVARPCPWGDVSFFASLACPGAGSHQAREDAPLPLASARKVFGRLVRHTGKARMGVRGDARWVTHLPGAAQDFQDSAGSCFPDTRRGRIQVRDPLGEASRRGGAQAYAQTPYITRFAFTGEARLQFPCLEVAPN